MAVTAYAAEHSLKIVLDASVLQSGIVYFHDTADITTEIIRRIADYRGDEKHPSYARYTVQKAQAALHSGRADRQFTGNASGSTHEISRED